MDEHPFKNAYDPMVGGTVQVVACPVCRSQEFDARSNQYGVHRKCLKCGNEWSGGGVGLAPEHGSGHTPEAHPDEDIQLDRNLDAGYRSKGFIGGDE